ncbi:ROK family protein [Streptomyces sp. NPDC057966]|uniref:ROK family protein n=1 Tax=Streptomyces sp. NPDC057966 TaxID=3346292 RepID=UPI0036EF0B8A
MDIGGTTIKAATVAADGTADHQARCPSRREDGPDTVVDTVLDFAAEQLERRRATGAVPWAVGVCCPGIVDERAGVGVESSSLGWRQLPLRQLLSERLGMPVSLVHDVRAGGVAEARLGAGRGVSNFLFMPVGTGVGAALMFGGRPFPGAHWSSGELIHLVVQPQGGDLCRCGRRGCLATVGSAAAISSHYGRATGERGVPAEEVLRRATGGEPSAARVWDEAVEALAEGVAICAAVVDPALVVVGGGLALAGDLLLTPLAEAVARRCSYGRPELATAQLGDYAACIGAGLVAWDRQTGDGHVMRPPVQAGESCSTRDG